MLYTEQNVRANLRVRDGKRVLYLAEGDRLTPSAQDWLRGEGIEVLPRAQAAPAHYETPDGAVLAQKPEHMTHLRGNVLVPKDHPRIAFRGKIDTLEAEILLTQHTARDDAALVKTLEQMLAAVRGLIRADVLDEPVQKLCIDSMGEAELRERSHDPAKYYGQPHFMPSYTDGIVLLQLNRLRTAVRETELAAYRAFRAPDGGVLRGDLLLTLNRLSSLCWIEMIRRKAAQHG